MDKNQLLELRQRIVQTTQQIALGNDGSAEDRLQLLMNMIRSGEATIEILNRAFELSNTLDSEDKLSNMLDILYEVDAQLQASDQNISGEGPIEQAEGQPGQTDQPAEYQENA